MVGGFGLGDPNGTTGDGDWDRACQSKQGMQPGSGERYCVRCKSNAQPPRTMESRERRLFCACELVR